MNSKSRNDERQTPPLFIQTPANSTPPELRPLRNWTEFWMLKKSCPGTILASFLPSFCEPFLIILVFFVDAVFGHGFGLNFIIFRSTFQKPKPLISLVGVSEITFSRDTNTNTKMISKWCQNEVKNDAKIMKKRSRNHVEKQLRKKTSKWCQNDQITPKQAAFEWGIDGFSGLRPALPPKGSPHDAKTSPGPFWDRFFIIFWHCLIPLGSIFLSFFDDFASQILPPNVTSISPSKQKRLAFPPRKEGRMEGRKEGRKLQKQRFWKASVPPYNKVDFEIGKRTALQKSQTILKLASAPPYNTNRFEIGKRSAV